MSNINDSLKLKMKVVHPLKVLLVQRGVSQKTLADLVGIPPLDVYLWTNGYRAIKPETVEAMAAVLGVSPASIQPCASPKFVLEQNRPVAFGSKSTSLDALGLLRDIVVPIVGA